MTVVSNKVNTVLGRQSLYLPSAHQHYHIVRFSFSVDQRPCHLHFPTLTYCPPVSVSSSRRLLPILLQSRELLRTYRDPAVNHRVLHRFQYSTIVLAVFGLLGRALQNLPPANQHSYYAPKHGTERLRLSQPFPYGTILHQTLHHN